ncbi:ParB-like protein [Leptospira ryugenii]|uniref:ParB-like protein n=1 Tax=Leptospira ryugenii TaxID=1917863 RepID=A0A2P2E398_9LEPT|nr:ParB/RepB/Spo0J family partition protein [Leptospira ryugenii]GBF51341.1 ParB-like protein [Leptospira ryugenii]
MALGKGKVLGRGLSNLIPVNDKNEELSKEDLSGLREIKISEISINPFQPRKTFSNESLQELSQTIQVHGVIQPIVVQKNKSSTGYTLISGERRMRACKLAGFLKIPAIVKDVSENEMMEMALIENLQREDLNPVEEALAYQLIIDKQGLKVTELASKIGKNRSTVSNLVRLLSLPKPVLDWLREGKLSEGQARPLLSLPEAKKQLDVATKIVQEGWTARDVENHVSLILHPDKKIKSKQSDLSKDASIAKIETKLRNKYSSKVEIAHNESNGKGKITFSYANLSDMERVLELLGIKL